MATAPARRIRPRLQLGPASAGTLLTPEEFDRAEFEEGWRYELIHGVLIVSPSPLLNERDPNDTLGYWLHTYQETHPQGSSLDFTVPEHTIRTRRSRRRVDRVIWTGLGRLPKRGDKPSVAIEFVSEGKKNQKRDYEEKRDEYAAINIQEYWVIDRFQRTLTVFFLQGGRPRKRTYREDQTYATPLLPGFVLPLAKLFTLANRWPGADEQPE